jgi:hypothetical protein
MPAASRDRDRFLGPLVGVGATDVHERVFLLSPELVRRQVDSVVNGSRVRHVEVGGALRVADRNEMHLTCEQRVERTVVLGPRAVQRVHDGRIATQHRAADRSDDAGVVVDDVEPAHLQVCRQGVKPVVPGVPELVRVGRLRHGRDQRRLRS